MVNSQGNEGGLNGVQVVFSEDFSRHLDEGAFASNGISLRNYLMMLIWEDDDNDDDNDCVHALFV
ncbi:hypothetical protein ACTXT7_002184 [Hymenolepis weldensis]